jgi:2-(1,2-epoxy-1,2-dihydrophenyl)acetyl-CoA isomerase
MSINRRKIMSESVLYSVQNGVAYIDLNEPDSLNALSNSIKEGLMDRFKLAEDDPSVRIILLSGNGRAFCAGGDIKNMGNRTTLQSVEKMTNTSRIALQMEQLHKPIISFVHGYAVGAGFSLALASDMIFAEVGTKFGMSFSKVGLIPDCGALYYLPRIVGPWKAKELIFSGEVFSAQEAEKLGLLNRLFPKGRGYDESIKFAEKLAKGPVQTMRFVKSIMTKSQSHSLSETLEYEIYAQSILQQSEDHHEGITAFKEKRDPVFRGE